MKKGKPKVGIDEELLKGPHRFEFLAAMRLLEAMLPKRRSVAEGDDPDHESVSFKARPRLDFRAGEIGAIAPPEVAGDSFTVEANFFGVAQANGPLPYSFAEELIDRAFRHDHAGGDFLDIFHHRLLSILFRARKKYRPALTHQPPDLGRVGATLKALAGIGTRGLEDRLALPDRSLLEMTGLLVGSRRTQVGLERAVEHHFGVPAEVLPFRGGWKRLEGHQRTVLGRQNTVLRGPSDAGADGAVLGSRVFVADAGFELKIGPIGDGELEKMLPGGQRFAALSDLLGFYTDRRYDLALRPLVAAGAPRPIRLSSGGRPPGEETPETETNRPGRLGWNSWLLTRPTAAVDAQVVLRSAAGPL
jgi:type VI secretion system protein ImpH